MKKIFISAVLVLLAIALFIPAAGLASSPTIVLGGVTMYPGDYLASGGSATTTVKPSDNYAYFAQENGKYVLTLHNYSNEGAVVNDDPNADYTLISSVALTLTLDKDTSSTLYSPPPGNNNVNGIKALDSLTVEGSGMLTIETGINGHGIRAGNDVIVNSGTLIIDAGDLSGIYAPDGTVTLNGGKVEIINGGTSIRGDGFRLEAGTVDIDSVNSEAIHVNNAVISGGSAVLKATGYCIQTENVLTITGGSVELDSDSCAIGACGDVTITGGTVNINADEHGVYVYDGTVTISGGTMDIVSDRLDGIYADTVTVKGGNTSIEGCTAVGTDGAGVRALDQFIIDFSVGSGTLELTGTYPGLAYGEIVCPSNIIPDDTSLIADGFDGESACQLLVKPLSYDSAEVHTVILPTGRSSGADPVPPTSSDLPTAPGSSDVPATGDSAPLAAWLLLMVLSIAGIWAMRRRVA